MCGIAGSINSPFDPKPTLAALAHRGPDAQTFVTEDNVQLLHTRLSIVDSAGGAQPMRRANLLVSYNGEIYNHMALRAEHQLQCQTQSDTETLLALFEKYDVSCLNMLDGMFAIALYDLDKKRLILARDRAGEKPLYVNRQESSVRFASELNALGTLCYLEVDDSAVNEYLSTGVFFRSKTAYKNASECPAGCYLEIDTVSLKTNLVRWFEHAKGVNIDANLDNKATVLNEIDKRLHQSVKDRLLSSDLEVGAFLSGGIDSGLVTAIASEYTSSLKTFTVSFEGQFDESELASTVASKYNTHHHMLKIDYDNLDKDIEGILINYGEPICDDSVIPTWYVSKAAKEHVTVVLTGDGADELFGGYRRYVPYSRFDLFRSNSNANMLWKALHSVLPMPTNKMSYYNYGHRLIDLLRREGLDRYLSSTINLNTDGLNSIERCSELMQAHSSIANSSKSSLAKLMEMDFHTLLHGALLPKMDIGSMAHSLETRSPFLSADLLQLAPLLQDQYKINGKTTKYALRELAGKYLPEQVKTAPKRGFETSLENIVNVKLDTIIKDYLGNSNAYVRQFYRAGFIDELLSGTITMNSSQRARTLWMMFCVELWFKRVTVRSKQ